MIDSLLLGWPVGLFFAGRTRSSSFYYLLALGLPSPLRIRLFRWEEVAEGHEEEISVGEEEVWVEQASQPPPFLAGSPVTLEGCAGVSSGCPCFQECLVMEKIG